MIFHLEHAETYAYVVNQCLSLFLTSLQNKLPKAVVPLSQSMVNNFLCGFLFFSVDKKIARCCSPINKSKNALCIAVFWTYNWIHTCFLFWPHFSLSEGPFLVKKKNPSKNGKISCFLRQKCP